MVHFHTKERRKLLKTELSRRVNVIKFLNPDICDSYWSFIVVHDKILSKMTELTEKEQTEFLIIIGFDDLTTVCKLDNEVPMQYV